MHTAEFLSTLKISQLKDLLKSKNLTVGGNKAELIQKLLTGSQSVLPTRKISKISSSSAYVVELKAWLCLVLRMI